VEQTGETSLSIGAEEFAELLRPSRNPNQVGWQRLALMRPVFFSHRLVPSFCIWSNKIGNIGSWWFPDSRP
jgi:hypothetical protein